MQPRVHTLLDNFVRNPGSPVEAIRVATEALTYPLPDDYLEILHYMDGGEGFVGSTYVRLYTADKLVMLNKEYAVDEFAPGLVVFGSNGGGEAYAFDYRQTQPCAVQVPFIPMEYKQLEKVGANITELLLTLAEANVEDAQRDWSPNPSLVGKEIHEVLPIVFGGSATDRENKIALEPEDYAAYVAWWNRKYREIMRQMERS